MLHKMIRPDAKGRITLGVLAAGVSGYLLTETPDHKIILEPYVEIAAKEKWLFDNKSALRKVQQGLQDAAAGRLSDKGSFAQFANDDAET
jgi:hypothetical protein